MSTDSQLDAKIENFRRLLESGRDSALLRFSLGATLIQKNCLNEAIDQLELAIEQNPDYSAAHKLLAKAIADKGDTVHAIAAYEAGIKVAQKVGDKQAEKEMQVFAKRLKKVQ